jgi:virginiamycin B lyase
MVEPKKGEFKEYPLPQDKSGVMRPVTDQKGQIWFGEMGRNLLAVFNPNTQRFQQFVVPHGQYGIMGVAVAPDNTIWFAEQYANFIGHYEPQANHFTEYPLGHVTKPDASNKNHTISLPLAPNELALDKQGNVWFTEMNADALGKLNITTGKFTHYPLSHPPTVQQLDPYGITIDQHGLIWFTEAGQNKIGSFNPQTGEVHTFISSTTGTAFMEIISDRTNTIWLSTFNSADLIQFNPQNKTFTAYPTRTSGNDSGISGIYGLTSTSNNSIWITIPAANAIAHFDSQAKTFTYFSIPSNSSTPLGITVGTDHTVWFTESAKNQLGAFTP